MTYRGADGDDDRGYPTEPKPVAASLDSLARRLGAPAAAALGAVFGRWEDAVGESLAAHCRPLSLQDGVLVVAVDQPAWATQLRYLTPQLLQQLASVIGPNLVGRVDIRVERPGYRPRRDDG